MSYNPQLSATTSYQNRQPRVAVLEVAHVEPSGVVWLETYAERHVDVHFAICPYVESPEGQALAEEYIELTLPWRYRGLYFANKRRKAGLVRKIRPSDIAERDWQLEMLRSIDRAGKILRGDAAESEVASCTI